ncbi:Peptidyl-prolyl isomerase cwc27 [Acarospora aff. strigata]|nr:Peptidyl-prolyl isomerase cwc27 [Acarospora aff. strigata]
MSSLYNLEPQPTAKVLLQTTAGDILLELFAKQTPLTSRNFLQLCLDGYYDGTIFHRLVPGFIIQGGDPTGTGEGGEAIYDGGLFADEFHSRLKFNRRGLLGMANTGKRDDNGSQFFLTLGNTEELTGRNTMFGRVVGDTVYNLMKMGEAELVGEGSERPLYPIKITGAEILVNPFEDMVRRETKARAPLENKKAVRKKPKKQAGKALLSFGGDEEEGVEPAPVAKKAKFNTRLVSVDVGSYGDTSITNSIPKPKTDKAQKPLRRRASKSNSPPPPRRPDTNTQLPIRNAEIPSRSPSSSPGPEAVTKVSSLLDQTNAQIAQLKASMKRIVPTAPAERTRKESALQQMIPEGSIRGRKRKHGATGNTNTDHDSEALSFLNAFKAKLDRAAPKTKPAASPSRDRRKSDDVLIIDRTDDQRDNTNVHGNSSKNGDNDDDEEAHLCDLHFIANCQSCQTWATDTGVRHPSDDDDDDGRGWMSHALSFEKDRLGKDLSWRKKNEEELVVIDPREKGKEIRERERERGRGRRREGAGPSVANGLVVG